MHLEALHIYREITQYFKCCYLLLYASEAFSPFPHFTIKGTKPSIVKFLIKMRGKKRDKGVRLQESGILNPKKGTCSNCIRGEHRHHCFLEYLLLFLTLTSKLLPQRKKTFPWTADA